MIKNILMILIVSGCIHASELVHVAAENTVNLEAEAVQNTYTQEQMRLISEKQALIENYQREIAQEEKIREDRQDRFDDAYKLMGKNTFLKSHEINKCRDDMANEHREDEEISYRKINELRQKLFLLKEQINQVR